MSAATNNGTSARPNRQLCYQATSGLLTRERAMSVPGLQRHHHRLDLGIEFKDLFPLLAAPAGLHVDADRAGLEAAGHLVRGAEVAGPHARRKTVAGAVRLLGDAVEVIIIEGHRTQDRPEDLLAHDGHLRPRIGEDRRGNEIAFVADAAATSHDLRAIRAALRHVARDAVELFLRDERAHLGAGIEA